MNPIAKLLADGQTLRREIHPEVRIIDAGAGICEYIASDETLDSYREVIRVNGWQFDRFAKNAPFPDSHNYSSIDRLMGKVIDWRIAGGQLIERVQWALGIGNDLAELGWKMTVAGYLKAVSVGFFPTRYATKWDSDLTDFSQQMKELELTVDQATQVNCVYIQQQQIELSACIIGANPNALAKSLRKIGKAYKGGVITDQDVETFSRKIAQAKTALPAADSAVASKALRRKQAAILAEIGRML